jgi:flagellar protein FlaG
MSTDAFVAVANAVVPVAARPVAQPQSILPAVIDNNSGNNLPPVPQPAPIPKEQVQAAVQQIQKFLADSQRELEFRVDEASGIAVVTVRDSNGDIIRQMPNEETLRLAQILKESSTTSHALLNSTA